MQKQGKIIKKIGDGVRKTIDGFTPGYGHKRTFGQKAADALAKWAGSWTFIISFFIFLFLWMLLNTSYIVFGLWDEKPFILLNLVLSCIAAIQAPVILMSQNRAAQRDRLKAENDYHINREAKKEIEQVIRKLNFIEKRIR